MSALQFDVSTARDVKNLFRWLAGFCSTSLFLRPALLDRPADEGRVSRLPHVSCNNKLIQLGRVQLERVPVMARIYVKIRGR
jgi:hypothetical protein